MEVNPRLVFHFHTSNIVLHRRVRFKRQQACSLTLRHESKARASNVSSQLKSTVYWKDEIHPSEAPRQTLMTEEKGPAPQSISQSKYDVSFPSELCLQTRYRSFTFLSFLSFTDYPYYRFLTYTMLQNLVCAAGSSSSIRPTLLSHTTCSGFWCSYSKHAQA